ncbi:hypothetical protein E4412_13535 [Leptospira interrogans]|nr:hypothetical protein E4412_13535 [Leptospira interrogans]
MTSSIVIALILSVLSVLIVDGTFNHDRNAVFIISSFICQRILSCRKYFLMRSFVGATRLT